MAQCLSHESYGQNAAANPDDLDEGGVRSHHGRRFSGEIDPAAHLHAPARSRKPIRWEPFVDPDAMADAIAAAMAYDSGATEHGRRHSHGATEHGRHPASINTQTSNGTTVHVLQEAIQIERTRTAQAEARLEEALRSAHAASERAARAEAKLEMTQDMLAKMEKLQLASSA